MLPSLTRNNFNSSLKSTYETGPEVNLITPFPRSRWRRIFYWLCDTDHNIKKELMFILRFKQAFIEDFITIN